MSDGPQESDSEERARGELATIGDALGDLMTGIPAPIRKNAVQAFTRLCTAAVEYPVALLEGAIAEKRAESQARVKLINASAVQIADEMKVNPEYVHAASRKFAQKVVRERVNLDNIAAFTVEDLLDNRNDGDASQTKEAPPISENWLNIFENEASSLSSQDMQRLFGKILAGEIRKPTSYSVKTLRVMSQLDNQAASLFKKLCGLAVSMRQQEDIIDVRVVSMGSAGSNSLLEWDLGYRQLNVLLEYGLIISDFNSYMDYGSCVVHGNQVGLPLVHSKKRWVFCPNVPREGAKELRIYGVAMSQSGKEIFDIVDTDSDQAYTSKLIQYFAKQGLDMLPVSAVRGGQQKWVTAEILKPAV